jgi:hypothetical protein
MATQAIDRDAILNRAEPQMDQNANEMYPFRQIGDQCARFLDLLDELRRQLDEGFEHVRTVAGSPRPTSARRKSPTPVPPRSSTVRRRGGRTNSETDCDVSEALKGLT